LFNNKDLIISELERFIDFSEKYKLQQEDDIACSGMLPEEFCKYPPGTPGIHLYWDSEMESLQSAKLLLHYFKSGIDIQSEFPRIPFRKYIKTKINTINYLKLYPQYKNLIVGEINRGLELLLILCERNDWEKIYCYDERAGHEKVIKEFFKDDRITFNKQGTCVYDFNLLKEDNYIFVLNHSLGWGAKHWVTCPKVKVIIKDGVLLDPEKHWKEHKPEERIDEVFEQLNKMVRQI
jgi:hypothetical protein